MVPRVSFRQNIPNHGDSLGTESCRCSEVSCSGFSHVYFSSLTRIVVDCVYEYDKQFNGADAYNNTNGKFIVFYANNTAGWQWVGAYNWRAGNGPTLASIPTALDFVDFKGFEWTDVP